MWNVFSLDDQLLSDRKSTFLVKVKGKKKRLNLWPGDILVVDKNLPLQKNKLAVLVVKGKFQIDEVSEEFLMKNDPENGDFIWGMIKTVVRELK
jgi:SOS-response transcriptional repressor LexA